MHILVLLICGTVIGNKMVVPSQMFVRVEDVAANPILEVGLPNDTLVHEYVGPIRDMVAKLATSFETGQAFHLDSMYYFLRNLAMHTRDLVKGAKPEQFTGGSFTIAILSRMISALSLDGQPGINLRTGSPLAIQEYAEDFTENGGILYVDDIFDHRTFTQVCSGADSLLISCVDRERSRTALVVE